MKPLPGEYLLIKVHAYGSELMMWRKHRVGYVFHILTPKRVHDWLTDRAIARIKAEVAARREEER